MNINNLKETLKINGYKLTEQRLAILKILVNNNTKLISVEKILKQTKEIYHRTNMSTVYRNLNILDKLNLLYKVVTEDGISLYKLICSSRNHHHLICKQCGKTEMIDFCVIDKLEGLFKDKNFNLTNHKLEIYGYCLECNKHDNKL